MALPYQLRHHDDASVCGARRLGAHAPLAHHTPSKGNVLCVSGVWRVALRRSPDDVSAADIAHGDVSASVDTCATKTGALHANGRSEGGWQPIRVPSSWQMEVRARVLSRSARRAPCVVNVRSHPLAVESSGLLLLSAPRTACRACHPDAARLSAPSAAAPARAAARAPSPLGTPQRACASEDAPSYANFTYAFQPTPPLASLDGEWAVKEGGAGGEPGGMLASFVWRGLPPGQHGGVRRNPTAVFRRSVALPEDWATGVGVRGGGGAQAFTLTVHGADACVYAYVDGELVGYGADSRLPSEFDVTSQVRMALAECRPLRLALVVPRLAAGSYLEDQDMWNLSGLHRGVTLARVPAVAIGDYNVTPRLRLAAARGELCLSEEGDASVEVLEAAFDVEVDVLAAHGAVATFDPARQSWDPPAAAGVCLDVTVLDAETGELVASHRGSALRQQVRRGVAVGACSVALPPARARLWSAESPALYRVVLSLVNEAAGVALVTEETEAGLREVCVADGELRVNGMRATIRGANRHEHDAVRGKALTYESMKLDGALLKRANFNAVRCSHYPNSQLWYALCDRIGLYVFDEANLETHGFHELDGYPNAELTRDPQWAAALLERSMRMAERNKNHPCVLAWSLGNEAGFAAAHAAAAAWLRARDPSRLVHYEGGESRTVATDVVCPMYAGVPQLREWASEEVAKPAAARRPIVVCEYSHAMGNSNGGLDRYWEAFWERGSGMQGGFIWDWLDQGLLPPEGGVSDGGGSGAACSSGAAGGAFASPQTFLHGGHFDERPHDAQFCLNGLLGPDRHPHPAVVEAAAVMQPLAFDFDPPRGLLGVTNRHDTVSLGDVALRLRAATMPRDAAEALDAARRGAGLAATEIALGPSETTAFGALRPGGRAEMALSAHVPKAPWQLQVFALRGEVVVARAFFDVNGGALAPAPPRVPRPVGGGFLPPVSAVRDAERGEVRVASAGCYEAAVCTRTGKLTRLAAAGGRGSVELLDHAMAPALWRMPTDNDTCPGATSHAAQWRAQGLHRMAPVAHATVDVRHGDGRPPSVSVAYALRPDGIEKGGAEVTLRLEYTFERDRVRAQAAFVARADVGRRLDSFPRIGISAQLAAGVGTAGLRYLGLGPHECYADRAAAAYRGLHPLDPSAPCPYVVQQEHGGRAEAQFVWAPAGTQGVGLAVHVRGASTPRGAGDGACLAARVRPCGRVTLELDAACMGVGDSSWLMNCHEDYFLRSGEYALDLDLMPVSADT